MLFDASLGAEKEIAVSVAAAHESATALENEVVGGTANE